MKHLLCILPSFLRSPPLARTSFTCSIVYIVRSCRAVHVFSVCVSNVCVCILSGYVPELALYLSIYLSIRLRPICKSINQSRMIACSTLHPNVCSSLYASFFGGGGHALGGAGGLPSAQQVSLVRLRPRLASPAQTRAY